jgi:predicted phage baseplate assembly protein
MLPVGNYNLAIEVYHTVPGGAGNVSPGAVAVVEGYSDLVSVMNLLPASGGRNAESIEEIIRRAPSILTSRDRAVTRHDFEIIAKEASAEVSRAACDGQMGAEDGTVHITVLPNRREGEIIPDPFLAAGLKEHVTRYLARRCLVNVQPSVRLATFQAVDVSLTLRMRPNANILQTRALAQQWVGKFLDPYEGGLDSEGWPFQGTLFAQDFGRMVRDLPDVRHVQDVELYAVDENRVQPPPGWEEGVGSDVLVLEKHDLFVIRKVRVLSEDGAS